MRLACWIAMTCVVAGLCNVAGGAEKRAITADDYYTFKEVQDLRISPDGRHIVFVVTVPIQKTNKKISNLWIVPTDGSAEPRVLTNNAQSSGHPEWSPDGRSIAFISARPAPMDGTPGKPQVQMVPLNGGEAHAITDLKTGVKEFHFSPDGKKLVCISLSGDDNPAPETPDKSDTRHYKHAYITADGTGFVDDRRLHLWVVDIASGKGTQITAGTDWNDTQPEWSPDGSRIAFVSNRTGHLADGDRHTDIWTISPEGGALTRISNHDLTGWQTAGLSPMHHSPHWSPDGRKIAFLAMADEYGEASIWVAPAAGDAPAREVIKDVPAGDFLWRKGGIFYIARDRGTQQILHADPTTGNIERLTKGDRTISTFDIAATGAFAFLANDFQHPDDVYSADRRLRNERQVTFVNKALLDQLALPELTRIEYNAEDGQALEGFFAKPANWRAGRQYPLILAIHGGPAGMFGYVWSLLYPMPVQIPLGAGYAVLMTNPRGSSGYGWQFQRAVAREYGGKAYTDIMRGVDTALAQNPWIDPQRLGVEGASYGGYMTNWIISHSERFAAAVTLMSISNFVSQQGATDMFYSFTADFGGDLFQNFDLYWRYSPLHYVQNVKTPTLILSSQGDQRVPLEEGEQWFRALRHFNVPAELVIYPRGSHGDIVVGEPKHVVETMRWSTYWFDKYLNHNEAAQPPDALKPSATTAAAASH